MLARTCGRGSRAGRQTGNEWVPRRFGCGVGGVSFKVYYASDIHGSELLRRKFINAGRFYGAEVLIMGGDIAGKAVVPIVERGGAYYAPEVAGERSYAEDQVHALERRIRDLGMY